MKTKITIPVLLIGFNRPEVIKQSFDYIRKAKPEKLYIMIDGAREGKIGEDKLVEEVKEVVKNIDWECEAYYKFNEKNMGAEITVSSGISWVFETEEYAIILEDDIVAPLSFFKFAQEMLEKYKHDDRIYMVSSCNQTPIKLPNNEDYLFSRYGHTWGWATWKRAWDKFDLNINDFDNYLSNSTLKSLTDTRKERTYYKKLLTWMKNKGAGNNNWDYCWWYIRFKEQALSIVPRNHLSSNIGVYGLHARGQNESHYRPYDDEFIVTKYPKHIDRNVAYDKHHFKNHINKKKCLIVRMFNRIIRVLHNFLK